MKRSKQQAHLDADDEHSTHGRARGIDNSNNNNIGMVESAKLKIIPVSNARKRARTTTLEENNITIGDSKRKKRNNAMPRYEYEPLKVLDTRNISTHMVEVRICRSHINPKNEALKKRCLWGWKTYSSDSDLVCILIHLGVIPFPTAAHANSSSNNNINNSSAAASKNSNNTNHSSPSVSPFKELIVTLEIIGGKETTSQQSNEDARDTQHAQSSRITLPSHVHNGIRSRFWESYRGKRIAVVDVQAYNNNNSNNRHNSNNNSSNNNILQRLPHHIVIPDVSTYYTNPLRCCFDASNNPALVYSLFIVADRKTPKRLSKEVLYLEDAANKRYEISRCDKKQRAAAVATVPEDEKKKGLYVRFGRVDNAIIMDERRKNTYHNNSNPPEYTVPLKEQYLTGCIVVKWSAFKWSPAGLLLGNNHYKMKKISFRPKKSGDHALQSATQQPSDAHNNNIKPSISS